MDDEDRTASAKRSAKVKVIDRRRSVLALDVTERGQA